MIKPYRFSSEYYKEEFKRYIERLHAKVKSGETSVVEAVVISRELTDAYVEQVGERPSGDMLERISTILQNDYLSDRHPDKMTNTEYPIISEDQAKVRDRRSAAFSEVLSIGSDGRDYRSPTRDNNRRLKEALRLFPTNKYVKIANKERRKRYRSFTKVQPVTTYNVSELSSDSRLRLSTNFPTHLAAGNVE